MHYIPFYICVGNEPRTGALRSISSPNLTNCTCGGPSLLSLDISSFIGLPSTFLSIAQSPTFMTLSEGMEDDFFMHNFLFRFRPLGCVTPLE